MPDLQLEILNSKEQLQGLGVALDQVKEEIGDAGDVRLIFIPKGLIVQSQTQGSCLGNQAGAWKSLLEQVRKGDGEYRLEPTA